MIICDQLSVARYNILSEDVSLLQIYSSCKHFFKTVLMPVATSVICCHIAFENSLYSDQTLQNAGPDLDPKCLTLSDGIFMKYFFKKS